MNIVEAWYALGGPRLRGLRGIAWWRDGAHYSVHLFPGARWTWRDYGTGEFGDAADLVRKVLNCSYADALEFLGESRPARMPQRTQDSENARLWRRGLLNAIEQELAVAKDSLNELLALNRLTPDQMREKYRLIKLVSAGTQQMEYFGELHGEPLAAEYRASKTLYAQLTSDLLKMGAELEQADRELKILAREFVAEVMGV